MGEEQGPWLVRGTVATALASIVCVMEGMRGTVISRARALYRRIWEVALKSPCGSAVTIMTAFWGFRRLE